MYWKKSLALLLNWCRSYLANRSFKVSIGSEYSKWKTFNYSVPQGSCNGPTYYCLYASTTINHIDHDTGLNAFADDHTINYSFDPLNDTDEKKAIVKIERNLCLIHDWMNQNRLKMDTGKMELIYLVVAPCFREVH